MFAHAEATVTTVVTSVTLTISSVVADMMSTVTAVMRETTVTAALGVATESSETATVRTTEMEGFTVMESCLSDCEEGKCNSCLEHFLLSNLFF